MIRQFSAGGIVFRGKGELKQWLIRKPAGGPDYHGNLGWSFPKGWIDPGETVEQAAVREVKEEGGVEARPVVKLPTFKIFFIDKGEKVMKFITYFVMEWVQDIPEGFDRETEEVKWVNQEEAGSLLAFQNDKKMLKEAGKAVFAS